MGKQLKKLVKSDLKGAFEKLAEVARKNGDPRTEDRIKKTLGKWKRMNDLMMTRRHRNGKIAGRWIRLQKLMCTVLQSIASSSSPKTIATPASTTKPATNPHSKSDSGSSDESGSEESDSDESSSDDSSSGDSSSDDSSSDKSSSDSSSSDESTSSDSDSDTGSSPTSDDSRVADFKPKPSTPLDPGSSPRVSVTRKVSTLELETHPRKKRKIEGNGSPASDATGTRETQKAANDKPDVNGAKIAGSPLKPTETNDHLKPNGKGGKQPRKSNAPFQRIKAETIQFADERLKDNSFHSRGANRGDYGERAHTDLIVTRGDGFRKEKNKKKRGSYRGGEITLGTHSIKFT